jgi:hypothetical protein
VGSLRKILALLALLSAASFAASSESACAHIFRGEVVAAPRELGLTPGARAYLLGEGEQGGRVYRVVNANGSAVIRKIYKGGSSAMRNDLDRFRILEESLSGNPRGFRVAKAHAAGEALLELEDVEGEELAKVLERVGSQSEQGKALRARYDDCIRQLVQRLELHNTEIKVVSHNYITFKDPQGHVKFLYLHTRNIVVTPRGELVIVDPY